MGKSKVNILNGMFFSTIYSREKKYVGEKTALSEMNQKGQQKACNKEEKSDRTITILVHVQYIIANKTTK